MKTRKRQPAASKSPIKNLRILLICCVLLSLTPSPTAWTAPNNIILIDDFEAVDDWNGLTLDTDIVHHGAGAGRWDNHPQQATISKSFNPPLDASQMHFFECWLYSGEANGAEITLVLNSQNESDPEGSDYYAYSLYVTWTGWRRLHIPLENFIIARNPLGWQEIQSVVLSAVGWGHEPLPDTLLILDNMRFGTGAIAKTQYTANYDGDDFLFVYTLTLEERLGMARTVSLQAELPDGYPFTLTFQPDNLTLPANGTAQANVHIRIPAAQITAATQLTTHQATVLLIEGSIVSEVDAVVLSAAVPLPATPSPRLLLNDDDVARITAWAAVESWASEASNSIINVANAWPDDFVEDFYLTTWELPPEGGQWNAWYICPQGGATLRYEGPGRHVCPLDGQVYSGWPYDQVIYARMHSALARTARDLGIAYQLSGETAYAQSAAEILLAYADAYSDYPYHDIHDDTSTSGGRVTAQTLDESRWLISIAWVYDLISDASVLSETQHNHIKQNLLYAAVTTIARNPRGMSNWQSWHNAAIGAVGFALQDPILIAQALYGPNNSFEYQMQASVSADGFWFEGSWAYHLYALQAHRYLAEMAIHSGVNLYTNPELRRMFSAPLYCAMPDMALPPFNDSGSSNLSNYEDLYETAYRRYRYTRLAAPLEQRTRGRAALLWGAQTLPPSVAMYTPSILFPDAGYAVLRNIENNEYPLYLAFDFGPHGGGHGHYDKLGFVSYARGTVMGLDPGTQSYAAPTHNTWDIVTVAHNTIVVDEQTQASASGALHQFVALPGLSVASADAGEAYTTTHLHRTMILGDDYVLDHYHAQANDGQAHNMDWIYHNPGTLTTTLSLSAYSDLPAQDGYQHLSNVQGTTTSGDWRANFQLNAELSIVEDVETSIQQLELWMLGEVGTTVVTGNGLGPDLSEPIPFVMARRTAQTTTFATLMAPAGLTPTVTGFATLTTNADPSDGAAAYTISSTTHTEHLLTVPDGDTGTTRTFGEASCNGETCLVRRDGHGNLLRLILASGTQLDDDGAVRLLTNTPISGIQIDYDDTALHVQSALALREDVHIWGPATTQVTLNGSPYNFTREGEYVVLAAASLLYLPLIYLPRILR